MKKLNLIFPGAKGFITQDDKGYWTWYASYLDGSGQKFSWCPTQRGAMICCLSECRRISHNYGKVKYSWVKETT